MFFLCKKKEPRLALVLVDFKSLINGRLDVFWTRPLEVIPVDFIIGPGENGFSFFL